MRLSLLQRQENAHDDSVWAAAWSPTDNTLVTGSVDESVKLWRETGDVLEQVHHLVSPKPRGQGIDAAADRRCSRCLLASALQVGLSLGVLGVSVDPSGQFGAASSLDSYVTVWRMDDYSTGAVPARVRQPHIP